MVFYPTACWFGLGKLDGNMLKRQIFTPLLAIKIAIKNVPTGNFWRGRGLFLSFCAIVMMASCYQDY